MVHLSYRQQQIDRYVHASSFDSSVDRLSYRLSLCGRFATKNFYCKKDPLNIHLIKTTHSRFFCEIRYCDCPSCFVQRFARQIKTFNEIDRFEGLRKLYHFSIGFESIPLDEFKNNFSKHKKRYESVLNKYFEKLKQVGIVLPAIRVLDFSFVSENKVFPHYHFGAIPVGASNIRETMLKMQRVRIGMIHRQRVKIPFIFKSFGLASKKGVLSYLAIRAVGLYKWNSTISVEYKIINSKLVDSIKSKKYLFLKDVLTKEQYIKNFYNKAHFITIGGLPRPVRKGSNITDSIPNFCLIHGELTRKDIRIEIIFDDMETPPPQNIYDNEKPQFEVIKI